jgi:hypothetical protein
MQRGKQQRKTGRDTRKGKEMMWDMTPNALWRQEMPTPGSWYILLNPLSRYTYIMRAVISISLAHDKGTSNCGTTQQPTSQTILTGAPGRGAFVPKSRVLAKSAVERYPWLESGEGCLIRSATRVQRRYANDETVAVLESSMVCFERPLHCLSHWVRSNGREGPATLCCRYRLCGSNPGVRSERAEKYFDNCVPR